MAKILNLEELKRKIGFVENAWQKDVLSQLKRFTKIVGGKRSGKSFLSSYLAFRELMTSGKTIWVVAPTYELSTRVWDNIEPWARKFPNTLKIRKMDPLMGRSIENVPQGTVLRIKSADNPKQLKGDAGDLLVVEEAGDMAEDVWAKYLEPFISEKRPSGELGRAIFIGNSANKGHWFHRNWAIPEDKDNISFWIPTAIEEDGVIVGSNNPEIIGVEELQRIKGGNDVRTWEEQWLARWGEGEGQVFRGIKRCVDNTLKNPESGKFYKMGLDLAKHHDWTVLTVMDMHTFEVVYIDRFNQVDWNLQKMRVFETWKRYNKCEVWLDATGIGDPILDDLQNMGINCSPYRLSNASKKALINKASIYIEQAKIKIPDNPQLLKELELYQYKKTEGGTETYNAPNGEHDDMVISLALSIWGLPDSRSSAPKIQTEEDEPESYKSDNY